MRTFLGKPVSYMGTEYHPDKVSLDDFVIDMKEGLEAFFENMKNLNKPELSEEKFPEQWMELFLAWSEFLEK